MCGTASTLTPKRPNARRGRRFTSALSADNNESLAPTYAVSQHWVDERVRELVRRYNYTLNPRGVYEAVRYMYTHHPAPHCAAAARDQYIHVRAPSPS